MACRMLYSPGLVKGQWSRDEDDLLTKLVGEGHKNWGALAARIPGRTSKQCRERWCHHLDPRIVKGEWTEEEDRTLVTMHDEIGNKWATIAQVRFVYCRGDFILVFRMCKFYGGVFFVLKKECLAPVCQICRFRPLVTL